MVDGCEKVVDIRLQNPTVCCVVPAVILHHVLLQPHEGVVRPLVLLAGAVISYKALADGIVEDIVHDSVEHDFIHKSRSLDEPLLRLINREDLKLAGAVCSVPQHP